MRVSTAYIFDQNLTAMLNQQTELAKTQLQVSTGKRILSPSDDPAGSVQILNLQRELSLTEQYLVNADKAENKQVIEEGVLQSATGMLQRIRELAVQGLNSTNTQSDRQAIAAEITQLNEQLLALSNTRDSNGDYLFSGFKSSTQPYQTIMGDYQGDEGQRNIKLGTGVLIESNDTGNQVFESPLISTTTTTTLIPTIAVGGANAGSAELEVTNYSVDSNVFSDVILTFNGTNYDVTTGVPGVPASPTTITLPSVDLSTLDSNLPPITVGLVTGTPNLGDVFTISDGAGTGQVAIVDDSGVAETYSEISFTFQALIPEVPAVPGPAAPEVPAKYIITDGINTETIDYISGENIDLSSLNPNFPSLIVNLTGTPAEGDVITLEKSVTETSQSMFKTINNFANALIANNVGAGNSPNNGDFLTNISASLNTVVDTRAKVGARLNAIEQQRDINTGLAFNMEKTLSQVQDLDYAEAISRLSLQMAGLQAAQQSFVKVQGLSLFNYL
ncbi:MAG: flagellar hook-associated protein FlgL [Piscirickettsiaceae bacterium]|nr:flagellar hook-associated protein FlgL [Piscirickettsiaceae bacterium]